MNLETVSKLAKQANIPFYPPIDLTCSVESIYVFASLVAEAERQAVLDTVDALMGMERDRNPMFSEGYDYALEHIEQFVKGRK